jgi:retrograde regulation protein 2
MHSPFTASDNVTQMQMADSVPADQSPTSFDLTDQTKEPIMSNLNLHALVDMGSNGIRFSITDLWPTTARTMPTVFSDRLSVSLYDAQHKSGAMAPIPDSVIDQVVSATTRFKRTCSHFGVLDNNAAIIATEAVRIAENSEDLISAVEQATGWTVRVLSKVEEGDLGAFGVASSFSNIHGAVMDLGGGSTQLSFAHADSNTFTVAPLGSESLPYGAAALNDLLKQVTSEGIGAEDMLLEKIATELRIAIEKVCPIDELNAASDSKGLNLYVSGGGLRGWGYILMACSLIKPYPIPIINGFAVDAAEFDPNHALELYDIVEEEQKSLFRISKRRRTQVPAIAFLITALSRAMPIARVYFSQGGIREGYHYKNLEEAKRREHPLIAATQGIGKAWGDELKILRSAIPSGGRDQSVPPYLVQLDSMVHAFALMMNFHAGLPKDIRAGAALRSTTTGVLAGTHGLTHVERAWLGIALCRRWGDEVAPTDQLFYENLLKILGGYNVWWARYFGIVATAIADCYPDGVLRDEGFQLKVRWASEDVLSLEVLLHQKYHSETQDELPKWVQDLDRIGKKKRWYEGEGVKTLVYEQYRS